MLKRIVVLSGLAFSFLLTSIALANPNRVSECELNQRSSSCYNHGLELMKSSKPEDKKAAMRFFAKGCKFAKQTSCSEAEAKLAVRHHLAMTQPTSKMALVKSSVSPSVDGRSPAQTEKNQLGSSPVKETPVKSR